MSMCTLHKSKSTSALDVIYDDNPVVCHSLLVTTHYTLPHEVNILKSLPSSPIQLGDIVWLYDKRNQEVCHGRICRLYRMQQEWLIFKIDGFRPGAYNLQIASTSYVAVPRDNAHLPFMLAVEYAFRYHRLPTDILDYFGPSPTLSL